ncbi:MAG TPA: hypothetical protein VII69_07265 [Candidatus Eremiobacteraceae bacterium]
MSRVNDDDLRRLASALSAPEGAKKFVSRDESGVQRAAFERMQTELGQKAGEDALGRSLTQLLAAYLNRPVRAVAGGASGAIPGAWHYVARSGPVQWWIGFEAPLAASLADAMLGGTGSSVKSGGGRRARALVGKVADVFFEGLSSIVAASRPSAAAWTDAALPENRAQLAGRCVVTTQPYAWQAGVEFIGEAAQIDELTLPRRPSQDLRSPEPLGFVMEKPAKRAPDAPSPEAIQRDVMGEIRDIIAAACAGLFELLHCPVAVALPTVTEVEAPEVPDAALRLALTTGGKGALVVCAERDAVVAFASGAVGARVPEAEEIGSVVRAAADAVLREIVNGIAARLTRVPGAPQRIVYIAADAQLARTQHISAAITLHVDGNAANLRVLVPRWMAGAA